MSVVYAVIGIAFLVFSILVLFDIGQWSRAKDVMPASWRLTLGLLWAVGGCVLVVAGVLQKITIFVWVPVVVGAVIFFYFLRKAQQGAERV